MNCVGSKKLPQREKFLIVSGVPCAATKAAVRISVSDLFLAPSIPIWPLIFRPQLR